MLREDIVLLLNVKAYCDEKIVEIQEQCQHPKETLKEEHDGNTGNYDPSADTYWTTYTCKVCGKRWAKYR